jgi:hypothetical protein
MKMDKNREEEGRRKIIRWKGGRKIDKMEGGKKIIRWKGMKIRIVKRETVKKIE